MSIVDDAELIEEVKKYPLLYNNRYRNCEPAKEQAWNEISARLNTNAKEARSRWRTLRDKFVREKKIILTSGNKDAKERQIKADWPLMENMSFIWKHIVHRRKRRPKGTNVNVKNESMEFSEEVPEDAEWIVALDSNQTHIIKQSDSGSISPPLKKTKQIQEYEEQAIEELTDFVPISDGEENYSQRVDQTESFIADDNHYFCMAIAETMRRLPCRQRAEAKLKIQQLMFEIEFNQASVRN